jgi:hypothetical protein
MRTPPAERESEGECRQHQSDSLSKERDFDHILTGLSTRIGWGGTVAVLGQDEMPVLVRQLIMVVVKAMCACTCTTADGGYGDGNVCLWIDGSYGCDRCAFSLAKLHSRRSNVWSLRVDGARLHPLKPLDPHMHGEVLPIGPHQQLVVVQVLEFVAGLACGGRGGGGSSISAVSC